MPRRGEKDMTLKSEREIEENKINESRSYGIWIFILFGVTKAIILVVLLFYFYSSLMESRENIKMLQKQMVSMEKVCVQLAREAVKSRQKVDNLIKASKPLPAFDPYDYEELGDDNYQQILEHIQQTLYRDNATNSNNQSADSSFANNETIHTEKGNRPVYQKEERTDDTDIDADLCDIDLEEFKNHCQEVHSHHGRQKRSSQRGPVATHFKGGLPETFIRDSGLVAPWYPDNQASADFGLSYEFREGKGKVEVVDNGLYLIYAQVFYLTNEPLNSYVVNIKEKDSETTPVAYCSSNAVVPQPGGITEVTCYTSVVRYLNASTVVFLTQRDRNRRMILSDGHTFLGLVRLNKRSGSKRRQGNRN